MQLLWINLVTDSLPAISLGMEAVEEDVMDADPKPKHEGLFSGGFGIRIALQGLMFACLALGAFWIGCGVPFSMISKLPASSPEITRGVTMAFLTLSLSQVTQAFNMRSEKSLFKTGMFGNKTLNISTVVALLLTVAISLIPGVRDAFGLALLSPVYYLIVLGLVLVPFVFMEISKLFIRKKHK
jgi:Ca2+-transporting ATPase